MSKYDLFRKYLETRRTEQVPLAFAEIEQILGFPLPPSARSGPSWWSNNTGSHVGVRAWRDAGWKASRVDVAGERVTFVRAGDERLDGRQGADLLMTLLRERLSSTACGLLAEYSEEAGGDCVAAAARAIQEAAIARRRLHFEPFPLTGPRSQVDSVDLIREDRDAR